MIMLGLEGYIDTFLTQKRKKGILTEEILFFKKGIVSEKDWDHLRFVYGLAYGL